MMPSISETIRFKMSSSSREATPAMWAAPSKAAKVPEKSMTKNCTSFGVCVKDNAMTTERKAVDLPESGPPRIDM